MADDAITLIFSLPEYIDFPIGTYTDDLVTRYTLLSPANFVKINSRNYEYTLILEAAKGTLSKYIFRDIASHRLKFPLTVKPQEFVQLLVDNLNRQDSGWTVGTCIEANDININFSFNTCAEALQMIADAFKTEWEVAGKVINLQKVEYNKSTPLELKYGKDNGIISGVKRQNNNTTDKAIDVLYTQGGEKNIDPSTYLSPLLLLPISQTYDLDDEHSYITDADGFSLKKVGNTIATPNEGSLDCSEIYPSREGTISEVVAVDILQNFYDFIDTSIPDDLDYADYQIAGEKMTVIFQSGMIAGKEFEINYFHTVIGEKSAKRFEIVPQTIDGQIMPNETFKPVDTDKYAVFHIAMPAAYLCDDLTQTGASWDMFKKAAQYLSENENPHFTFDGQLDGIWAQENWINIGGKIVLGGYASLTDDQFQTSAVLIRIVGIKDYINKPYQPQIELSNVPVGTSISTELGKIATTEVTIETAKNEGLQFTKRQYQSVQETMDMLNAALLNYSGSINPITLQTMQAIVGDESLQFRFVTSKTTPTEIDPTIVWTESTKLLTIGATIIQHMTLGISTLGSSHEVSEYLFWNMAAFTSPALTDATKKYYLYAKVSKITQTGIFYLSETPIAIEALTGYYYLLIGLINSEFEDDRNISLLYGFTEILPGRITTNRIQSDDASTYFDLVNGEIGGNIKFKSGNNYIEVGTGIADAVNNIQVGGRNLVQNSDFDKGTTIGEAVADGFSVYNNDPDNEPVSPFIIASGGVDNGKYQRIEWEGDHQSTKGIIGNIVENWKPNTEYIISFWAKGTSLDPYQLLLGWDTYPSISTTIKNPDILTTWQQYVFKIKWGATVETEGHFFIYATYGGDGGTVDFDKLKIEIGNVATDWTEAPEDTADAIAENVSFIESIKSELQGQIDKQITSWFYNYGVDENEVPLTPTLDNYPVDGDPAGDWSTNELKNNHLGDLCYDLDTGHCFRFALSGTYQWVQITDSDFLLALAAAAAAQDTADGKRRVFTAEPTTPYDAGDLWAGGSTGDLKKCTQGRVPTGTSPVPDNHLTGIYQPGDWVLATKYTDDTAVTNLIIGGRNLLPNTLGTYQTKTIPNVNYCYFTEIQTSLAAWDLKVGDALTYSFIVTDMPAGVTAFASVFLKVNNVDTYPNCGVLKNNGDVNTFTFTIPALTTQIAFFVGFTALVNGNIRYKCVKVERGSKATGWTPAPEDITAAISVAQAEADAANAILDAVIADGTLSTIEKITERARWNQIVAEKSTINTQAGSFSLTSANTTYNNAFAALANYLNAGNTWSSGYPAWLADTTQDTTIVGADYKAAWDTYFAAYGVLLNAISTAAKQAGTDASTALNQILSDLGNNNKLTSIEKMVVKLQWDMIATEYPTLSSQGEDILGVADEYEDSYSYLHDYLFLSPNGILLNMSTTSNITKSVFDSNFNLYYQRKAQLISEMSAMANSRAAAAQVTATSANNAVLAVIADGTLSTIEKASETVRWNEIISEKTNIDAQATSFSITTAKTNYDNSFTALANYLNAGNTWSSGLPSWLADTTHDTTIVNTSLYKSNWATYYSTKILLLNAISTAAKQAGTDASAALNQIITDLGTDGQLSVIEKGVAKAQWDLIAGDYINLTNSSVNLGVSTTNLASAYTALSAYLFSTGGGILGNMLITSNADSTPAFIKANFDAAFNLFYQRKAELLTAISQKAVDNLVIGGSNLLYNSDFSKGLNNWNVNLGGSTPVETMVIPRGWTIPLAYAPVGSAGLTHLVNGLRYNQSTQINLPFNVCFNNVQYSSIFVNDISYITFGSAVQTASFSATSPNVPTLFISAHSRNYIVNLYAGVHPTKNNIYVIRYEGNDYNDTQKPLIWEAWFYKESEIIDIHIVANTNTSTSPARVDGMSTGSAWIYSGALFSINTTTGLRLNPVSLPSNILNCISVLAQHEWDGLRYQWAFGIGVKYTLSFWIKSSHAMNVGCGDESYGYVAVSSTTTWQKIVKTFTSGSPSSNNLIFYAAAGQTGMIYLANVQLEIGDKATDYKKNTNEIAVDVTQFNFLKDALSTTTDIDGGLMATALLRMKDPSNNFNGGLSGLNDNVGFWTGGTYADALLDSTKAFKAIMSTGRLDKKDGSGHGAKGNFAWDIGGNLFIKGILDAISGGNIGAFNIIGNSLTTGSIEFGDTPVESLSLLLSPVNVTTPAVMGTGVNTHAAYMVLTMPSTLSFKVTTTLLSSTTGMGFNIYIRKYTSGYNYGGDAIVFSSYLSLGTGETGTYSVSLPAGNYYISVELAGSNTDNISVSINSPTDTGTITAAGYVSQSKIGNNGFYSFWGATSYFYFSSTYGFEVRFGNYGLRATSAGLQKMTTGTWGTL
jgi:hypothetical protein